MQTIGLTFRHFRIHQKKKKSHKNSHAIGKITFNISSKKVSEKVKVRNFNTYADATFLYNSETWTITETQAKAIDAFQGRKIRQAIGIKWPHTISNEALYNRTKIEKWSKKIQKRRLNLFGHIMRLPSETPIRQSIKEALTKNQRPQGRPPTTWIEIIRKDLAQHFNIDMNITNNQERMIESLYEETEDRDAWWCRVYHAVTH